MDHAPQAIPLAGPHLSDEQFTELLADAGSLEAQDHLAACSLCRDEFASLRSSLADFNELSLSWAGERAPRRIPVPSRAAIRWHGAPVWSAVAAGLTAAVFLSAVHNHNRESELHQAVNVATSATAGSAEEDDRLLLAIDQELSLSRQTTVSASELGLAQGGSAQGIDQGLAN